MLLLDIKAIFLVNALLMKKDQVTLRQIWIAEIGFVVLNQLIRTYMQSLTRDQ